MGCYDRPERAFDASPAEAAGRLSEAVYPTITYPSGLTDHDKAGRQAVSVHGPAILSFLVDKGIIKLEQLEALK